MNILLTGGLGFIGSHTAVELLQAGYGTVIVDDLSNAEASVAQRIGRIAGTEPKVYIGDAADAALLDLIFEEQEIGAVIHFAGSKAVGESVREPLRYYANNIGTALATLAAMQRHGVNCFVFSSSATVYGADNPIPYTEEMPTGGCTNPYGWTKCMIEQMARDLCAAAPEFSAVLLRYFNPVGAHESGLLGEKPRGVPNNLMPYLTQTAAGLRQELSVFGNDYPTRDGTGVRDYIHVVDLARGHVAALRYGLEHRGAEAINLGTGRGCSVLELIAAFEKATGVPVPHRIAPRRPGDLAEFYADPRKAQRLLGWQAERSVEDMCRDAWRWQQSCAVSEA